MPRNRAHFYSIYIVQVHAPGRCQLWYLKRRATTRRLHSEQLSYVSPLATCKPNQILYRSTAPTQQNVDSDTTEPNPPLEFNDSAWKAILQHNAERDKPMAARHRLPYYRILPCSPEAKRMQSRPSTYSPMTWNCRKHSSLAEEADADADADADGSLTAA